MIFVNLVSMVFSYLSTDEISEKEEDPKLPPVYHQPFFLTPPKRRQIGISLALKSPLGRSQGRFASHFSSPHQFIIFLFST